MNKQIPKLDPLGVHSQTLAKLVASTSYLPDPKVVKTVGRAVFPSTRDPRKRFQHFEENGIPKGMYDDNTTPQWALLWAHGITGGKRKGWTFAHVWPAPHGLDTYTHLANLIMVPECFASLTDKEAPLTGYLRWHACSTYNWKPSGCAEPPKPVGYDDIHWRYLEPIDDPMGFIAQRVKSLQNKRLQVMRPFMQWP